MPSTTAYSTTTVSQPSSINRLGVHGIGMKVATIIAFALSLKARRKFRLSLSPSLSLALYLMEIIMHICKSDKYTIAQ